MDIKIAISQTPPVLLDLAALVILNVKNADLGTFLGKGQRGGAPMPVAPPVITATLPAKRSFKGLELVLMTSLQKQFQMHSPPSTTSACPVMKVDMSDAKNRIELATSSEPSARIRSVPRPRQWCVRGCSCLAHPHSLCCAERPSSGTAGYAGSSLDL